MNPAKVCKIDQRKLVNKNAKDKIFACKKGKDPPVGLNELSHWTVKMRIPLQVEDIPRNDPHLVPSFLRMCCGMFPEKFRSVSVPVGSRVFHLV